MERISLPQRLTVAQTPELWGSWKGFQKQELVVDVKDVHQVDVAGLQLLLKLKLANQLTWEAHSDALYQAASLAGVEAMLALPGQQEGQS
ncbi:STAS domain-containing protein [Gallaecimonas pentaromativorans]|uniref:STAS domain-containing protein n=1 Tax=Gallaecimonas pentaromativorans TaxID=584787 RepID=A0A3N1NY94_9GAMM|nr:STAS domain-containing protein [Gallaecimonas pentaromativorans]ROQ24814.1 STAS domain-containing protein [Gallaecimonas pentaromativorans]